MRKAVALILDLLALACFAGVYALDYFTKSKLGMTRWVNYNANALRESLPVDVICMGVAVAGLTALLILIVLKAKLSRPGAFALALAVFAALCALAAVGVCLGIVHTTARPFTLMVAALAAFLALLAVACSPWERRACNTRSE